MGLDALEALTNAIVGLLVSWCATRRAADEHAGYMIREASDAR